MSARKLDVKILGAVTLLAAGGAIASPREPGKVVTLAPSDRSALRAEVAKARAADPGSFARFAAVKGYLPAGYKRTRARRPEVGRELKALGPSALFPMLEALALTGAPHADLTDEERVALELGLLDAVGAIGDARAVPVLAAALQHSGEQHVIRGAALALGAHCGAVEEKILVEAAPMSWRSPRTAAVVEGLARCRTVRAANALSGFALFASTDEQRAHVAQALGIQGSSWAAQAGQDHAAADEVRRHDMNALVDLAARADGAAADAIVDALAIVDHPETAASIDKNRAAAATVDVRARARYEQLAASLAARPRH
jgi:hypothetical protein